MALYAKMKGPIDYTVVGSPTITDGVASGFSSTDYLSLPNWTDEGKDIELCLTFLLPQSYVTGSRPMNQIGSGGTWSSYFTIDSYQGGLSYRIKSGESLSISYSLQNETKYIAKLVRQAGTYTLYLLDEQKNILATSSSLQTSTLIGNGYPALMRIGYESSVYGNEFPGEIYLQDQTYLKVNGQLWFGYDFSRAKIRTAPYVKYAVVGSTTITDGVARGFDSDNYIKIDTTDFLNLNTITDLEAVYVLDNCGQGNLGSSPVSYFAFRTWLGFTNSGNLVFELNTEKTGESGYTRRDVFDYSYLINTDGKIWLKFTKVDRTFKLQYSLDGNSYSNGVSYTLEDGEEVQVGDISEMVLRNARTQQGGIYLNETYIKVNGQYWFNGAMQNVKTWTLRIPSAMPPVPRYDVGQPSFLMRFDGSWKYYSDGNITAQLVNSPSLTTGGPWGLGALDQTYYPQDTSIRRSVQVNMTAAQQTSQSFFIEYWARLDNTDQSIYQTFLGNIIHPDTTYSGWSFRWWPRTGSYTPVLSMFVGNGTSTTANSYNELGYNLPIQGNTQNEWISCCEAAKNNWCHYGVYFNKQNTRVQFYINGRCFYERGTYIYNSALTNPQPNFLIADAKYGTGYTLSPMAEVRVLLGQNADDYATEILIGKHIGGYETFDYTVPTASFADGGLTKYTAQ